MKNPLSILFADHDLSATRPHRMDLRRRGARVGFAENAPELLEMTATESPEVLVLDDRLQTGADLDLIEACRQRRPDLEIILLHEDSSTVPHGLGMGLLFSARKPISRASLVEIIDEAFPGRLGPADEDVPLLPTVICVDDDRAFLASLSRTLRRRGYPVATARDAREVLEMLPRFPRAVVLSDVLMTGMDGFGLTREIRDQSGGQVPVVLLTGFASDESTYLALDSGARFCLPKPFETEDLLNIVDHLGGATDPEERLLLERRLASLPLPKGPG